jgi:hypothetical protein
MAGKQPSNILTVSSFHIAWSCVPSITAVKIAKRRASNTRNSNRTTVAGGEYAEHSFHS